MRFFAAFLGWLFEPSSPKKLPSSMNNAACRDHFLKAHFDANGNYIFKDPQLARAAEIARTVGATMTVPTFVQDSDTGASLINSGSAGTLFSANVTSTNSVCVFIYYLSSAGTSLVTGVTSTFGTFTKQEFVTTSTGSGQYACEAWTCLGASGGGKTITATLTGGIQWTAQGTEWSGTGVIGSANTQSGTVGNWFANYSFGGTDDLGTGNAYIAGGLASGPTSFISPSPWTAYNNHLITSGAGETLCAAWMVAPDTSNYSATWSGSASAGSTWATIGIVFAASTAPNAPTNLNPTNGGYEDATAIIIPAAQYNSTDGQSQNAYAFRIKVSGGSYSYWNASSSTLVGSIVWNTITTVPGASFSFSLPANKLSNGNVYNYSFASQESSANLQGSFATDLTFSTAAAPAVAITAPSGTITTNTPVVTWTDTLSSGDAQTHYLVVVESGSFSTTPGAGTELWTSGTVASSATGVTTGVALPIGTSLRVFVAIADSFGSESAWVYSNFTVAADVPATPSIVAVNYTDPTSGLSEIQLTVQGQDNQLTRNQSSLESNATTGWTAGTGTTIAASNTWSQDGTYSLRMTVTSSGDCSANTPTGLNGVPCVPGETIRVMASFHCATASIPCLVTVVFYNASGTFIAVSNSNFVNATTSGIGAQAFLTETVPAGSAFMSLALGSGVVTSSEPVYADCMLLGPGSSTTWTIGGFVGTSTLAITRSDGLLVRGAGWPEGADVPANQMLTLLDPETSSGVSYTYSATVGAEISGVAVSSSPGTSAPVTVQLTQWDVSDPNDISTGTMIDWAGDSRTFDEPEAQGIFPALGRATNIVVRGDMYAETPTQLVLQFGADEDAAYQAFKALREQQVTVMLRGDMPGDFFYVALGPSRPTITNRTSTRLTSPSRNLTIAVNVVDRP